MPPPREIYCTSMAKERDIATTVEKDRPSLVFGSDHRGNGDFRKPKSNLLGPALQHMAEPWSRGA